MTITTTSSSRVNPGRLDARMVAKLERAPEANRHAAGNAHYLVCIFALPLIQGCRYCGRGAASLLAAAALTRSSMAVIATLLPNGAHLQRVRTAVRDRHEL